MTSLILVLATGALEIIGIYRRNVQYQKQQIQAYYIAEAGIERAIARIREDPSWLDKFALGREERISELEVPYAGGEINQVTLRKTAEGMGWKIELTSVGKFISAQKTLRATLYYVNAQTLMGGLSLLPDSPLDLDITGNFSLENVGQNWGRLLLNGNLKLSGSAHVEADVYASGSVEGRDKIEGQVYAHFRGLSKFPEIDLKFYEAEARRAGQYYPHDLTLNGTRIYSGIYYVKGNLTLSGTYSGQATLVVEGDVSIPRDLLPGSSYDAVTIICLGNVDMENSTVKAVIITGGSLSAKGNGELEGALVARGLNFGGAGRGQGGGGSVTIRYNPQLIQSNLLTGVLPQLTIISWKENYPIF
ncbi:hypothetical protein [Thermanaeromonas toyohensis]|nr:hypothetical protein [Thermanaeromonas toyohensis]